MANALNPTQPRYLPPFPSVTFGTDAELAALARAHEAARTGLADYVTARDTAGSDLNLSELGRQARAGNGWAVSASRGSDAGSKHR